MAEYQQFDIDMDLSGVETWDGAERPLVPPGDYKLRVENIENKGKMLSVTFVIVDGDNANSKVWQNYMINNDTGKKRLKNLMVACGANLSRFNSDELLGATLYGEVFHQDGQAKPDSMGNPLPAKTFCNVRNERSIDAVEGGVAANSDPTPPPITRGGAPADAAKGGNKRSARA